MEKVGTIEENDTMVDATNYFKGSMVIMSWNDGYQCWWTFYFTFEQC
jgi:hypothetical protein